MTLVTTIKLPLTPIVALQELKSAPVALLFNLKCSYQLANGHFTEHACTVTHSHTSVNEIMSLPVIITCRQWMKLTLKTSWNPSFKLFALCYLQSVLMNGVFVCYDHVMSYFLLSTAAKKKKNSLGSLRIHPRITTIIIVLAFFHGRQL